MIWKLEILWLKKYYFQSKRSKKNHPRITYQVISKQIKDILPTDSNNPTENSIRASSLYCLVQNKDSEIFLTFFLIFSFKSWICVEKSNKKKHKYLFHQLLDILVFYLSTSKFLILSKKKKTFKWSILCMVFARVYVSNWPIQCLS